MNLKEFFAPVLREGPLDPTFQSNPEVPAEPGAELPPEASPEMTQDVAKMSASSLQFFTKNVQSAVSKYNMQQEGFDDQALTQFAGALDALCFGLYQQVQEPADRQSFEAEYQRLAADWAKDLTKLFDKVLKLKSHSSPY
jgi:hypothetical protein